MNNWIQLLRLAFLLCSLKPAVGKNFITRDKSRFENAVSFMRSRRMMLGIGSEASPSNIWGYLDPEPESPSGYIYSRRREKRSTSGVSPAIVLPNGARSEVKRRTDIVLSNGKHLVHDSGPQASASSGSASKIVLRKASSSQKGIQSRASDSSELTSKIVLLHDKSKKTSSPQHSVQPRNSDSSEFESTIVLSNGKRSVEASFPHQDIQSRASDSSELTSKIVLLHDKQSKKTSIHPRSSDSAELESKIVLSNGKRTEKSSFPHQGIQSRASDSSKPTSKIILPHGKRSEVVGVLQNGVSGSGIWRRGDKISKKMTASQPSSSDIVLRLPTKWSRRDSEKWRGGYKLPNEIIAFQPAAIESDNELGNTVKRSQKASIEPKQSLVANTPSNMASVPTGKYKVKRYELDLMLENFAKPLPIYE